jgi:tripartite-type tricarboxylate transporter receptor subunit TctC
MVMKKRMFWGISTVALGFILCIWGEGVAAEKNFPSKPIQVIIPFAPGDTDQVLRPFIERMPEFLGQPMNFIYKPGAGGTTGIASVVSSKPDGYTLVGSSPSGIIVIPSVNINMGTPLSYTYRDLAQVTNLILMPTAYSVLTTSPWKSFQDLVAAAKKDPGKYTYSSSGTYGSAHIMMEAAAKQAGIKLNYIPSTGAGPAVTAVLGGHVHIAATGIGPIIPYLKAGTMRTLVQCDPQRARSLRDVPTFTELGYPIIFPGVYGLHAPKGTPKEVIDKLHLAAKKVGEKYKDEISSYLEKFGAEINTLSPEEFTAVLAKAETNFLSMTKDLVPKKK